MTTLSPWINFNGNAEDAFNFYKSVIGGDFAKITRFKDVAGPEFQVAKEDENKIMQIVLKFGNGNILMGNDVPAFMGVVNEHENRSKIHISGESIEESERLFNGLSAEGEVEVPPADSSPGTYFSMFRDKYGIEWIVEFNPEN
jgi:PhnB protein